MKLSIETVIAAAQGVARAIPPLWPLASSVAVNPFFGQSANSLAATGAVLARVSGSAITMPHSWYREKLEANELSDGDLIAALEANVEADAPSTLAELKAALSADVFISEALPTVSELAANHSGTDWPAIFTERFGAWAAGHFDAGQALWAAPKDKSTYAAWRAIAIHDLSPEILGLKGFARFIADCPENAADTIYFCSEILELSDDSVELYFHRLLTVQGGWAQYARFQLWQAEMEGMEDQSLTDCLAIALIWEAALYLQYKPSISAKWHEAIAQYAAPVIAGKDDVAGSIFQDAFERAGQRNLSTLLAEDGTQKTDQRPALQMAFCIDVRSEVFRRALERQDPNIETIGFAGFFGLGASHHDFASDIAEHRLPVLLNAGLKSQSGTEEDKEADLAARYKARAVRAWGRFKLAAVSSFAFVEASGPIYIGKLLRDGMGRSGKQASVAPAPHIVGTMSLTERATMAENILRAMSLTHNFARLVVFAGHGATVKNNPHHSALKCGACGGYSGEVNARLLASLLNDDSVKNDLVQRGISIPADTIFVAALHDTTTDNVTLYDADYPTTDHVSDLLQAQTWLAATTTQARSERALRLPRAKLPSDILPRSTDWSEIRPEWGLAGCSAFIAAPRERTAGKNLAGRAFLHNYAWEKDGGFGVLELILTAPVVVASWISLQYYGSTVMPQLFGGGNKLIHNVVGGIGVIEGNGGNLRPGLPWQSVHDGNEYAHDPRRLTVCIEAPRQAISDILAKHSGVRDLFDNGWLHLFALDDNGHMRWRYTRDLNWLDILPAKNGSVSDMAA